MNERADRRDDRTLTPHRNNWLKRCAIMLALVAGIVTLIVVFAAGPAAAVQGDLGATPAAPAGLTPASADDPVVIAAGDIACPAGTPAAQGKCQQQATANLVTAAHPTAVLALGDLQYECGKLSQYLDSFTASWGQFKDLIHPAPGNHDYNIGDTDSICADGANDASGYYQYFGAAANPLDPSCESNCQGYYSFDLGSWHVIALNSNCAQIGGCGFDSPEMQWLNADLADHPAECTIAYWHNPRFSSGASHGNDAEMQPFWETLDQAGVEIVLNGHEHDYERFAPLNSDGTPDSNGMTEFVVGTGGRDLYGFKPIPSANSLSRGDVFGVLRLGLHEGWYDWRFLPIPGASFTDSGSATCHGARADLSAPASPTRAVESASPASSPLASAAAPSSPTATSTPSATSTPVAVETPAPGVLFQDNFESGNLDKWASVAGFTIQPSAAGHVLRSAASPGANDAIANLNGSASDLYASVRFNARAIPPTGMSVLSLGADGNPAAVTAGVDASGLLTVTFGATGEVVQSHTPVTSLLWHQLQLHVRVEASQLDVEVWYDGVHLTALQVSRPIQISSFNRLRLGDPSSTDALSIDLDDVIAATRFIDQTMLGTLAPKSAESPANPAPNQSLLPSAPAPTSVSVLPKLDPRRVVEPELPNPSTIGVNGNSSAARRAQPSTESWTHVKQFASLLVLVISLFLTSQGFFTLALMLYTWARADRLVAAGSPSVFAEPELRFTAILPARHEREVIAHTVQRVWNANYPKDRLEVVVVCEHGDTETIAEAQRAASEIDHPNVRVLTFTDGPINKPHGLNYALRHTTHEVVTIFDAEDDVHRDVFNVANTVMQRDGAGIVQAGVQLMDFQSTWFAIHNVLEYFFWFKSRLHFHAQVGMVPLGGNTVFMRRKLIEMVGGWDEQCLTEDADIGIRLSTLGERITITYDASHATREETPPTLTQFIKQRTRWNQGFLQVLRKRVWTRFPKRTQRWLAAYTLTYPFVQSLFGLLWIPALICTFALKLNVAVAMISLLPLYALIFQFTACLLGLFDFARAYRLKVRPRDLIVFTISFLPYQVLLSLGAIRAVYREQRGRTNWEKTAHTGAHRTPAQSRALEGEAQ